MSTVDATSESLPNEPQPHGDVPAASVERGSSIYDPSTEAGEVGVAFKRAMVAMRRLRGRETQRIGQLSFAQLGLLHGLSDGHECSARQLAEQSSLSPATVTQMLESLEAAGLVRRTRSEQDRRVVHTVLTEQGAAVVAARQRDMEERWERALGEFSYDDLAAAARVLNRVTDMIESLSREAPEE